MDVVEPQDERAAAREAAEEVAQRPVDPVAVGGLRAAEERQRRGVLQPQAGDAPLAELLQVRAEGLRPDRVGQVVLELRGRGARHAAAGRGGALRELGQQPRLADPRLALDGDDRPGAVAEPGERPVERRELRLPSDQPRHRPIIADR